METGYSAAGNGYKQDWEQVTGFLIVETGVSIGRFIVGCATNRPTTAPMIMPANIKVVM